MIRVLLSLPQQYNYAVVTTNDITHKVRATSADEALHLVCRKYKLKERQCKVTKLK